MGACQQCSTVWLEIVTTGLTVAKGGLEFDSCNFPVRPKDGGLQFANYMFAIYSRIAALGLPNLIGARIPVPTNLNIKAWAELALTPQ